MTTAISSLLLLCLSAIVSIPVATLLVEIACAVLIRGKPSPSLRENRPRIAVIVPAHNEGKTLEPTLNDINLQLHAGDRLLVVADNCTDDTAEVAIAAGAEVIVRDDRERIGKGYALDFGIGHLDAAPPEIVVIVDADCRLSSKFLDELAACVLANKAPAQALYLISAPHGSFIDYQVAEFAVRIKNHLRPLGLAVLGLPCQLMGTGMAFPWDAIRAADLASGHIVEDLKLGLDLASAGRPSTFCPSARVTSEFPFSASGAITQRERWERGHLGVICTTLPKLAGRAIAQFNWALFALVLDAAVPPLVLLAVLVVFVFAVTVLGAALGLSFAAFVLSFANVVAFGSAAVLAWYNSGRDLIPAKKFGLIFRFACGKLSLYRRFLERDAVPTWIRTDRDKS